MRMCFVSALDWEVRSQNSSQRLKLATVFTINAVFYSLPMKNYGITRVGLLRC
jgi:hypothetical protein